MPAEETILHAVWKANLIDLIYDPDDEMVIPPTPTTWYIDCVAPITDEIPERPGYTFVGWAVAPGSSNPDYVFGEEGKDESELDPPIVSNISTGDGGSITVETNPNIVYGVWAKNTVTLVYWSFTEESPDVYVPVKTLEVSPDDFFNNKFDQNKDVDENGDFITDNDYLPYKAIGWYDWAYNDYFDATYENPDDFGYDLTIQYLIDLSGLDEYGWVSVYAELEVRTIEVTFDSGGYDVSNDFESVQYFSWFDSPILGLAWQGNLLYECYDDNFDLVDETMSCGDILIRLGMATEDWLNIMITWDTFAYTIHYQFPDGTELFESVTYEQEIPFKDVDMSAYPGQTFVGWFTVGDGYVVADGIELIEGTRYGKIVTDHEVFDLYYTLVLSPAPGTSSSPAAGADDIANGATTGNAPVMGPASSDSDTTDANELFATVLDSLGTVRLPQLVGTSTIGVVEASRALTGAEAMVVSYAAPAVAVYEVAGEPQSSRTGAANVTTVSRTATNNDHGCRTPLRPAFCPRHLYR